MATKKQFLDSYKANLIRLYGWARAEPARLERFMTSVKGTLDGGNHTWNNDGQAYEDTLKALGLRKRIALKDLKALPNE